MVYYWMCVECVHNISSFPFEWPHLWIWMRAVNDFLVFNFPFRYHYLTIYESSSTMNACSTITKEKKIPARCYLKNMQSSCEKYVSIQLSQHPCWIFYIFFPHFCYIGLLITVCTRIGLVFVCKIFIFYVKKYTQHTAVLCLLIFLLWRLYAINSQFPFIKLQKAGRHVNEFIQKLVWY